MIAADIQGGLSKMNRRFGFLWIWGLVTAAIATVVGLVASHAGQTAQIVTSTGGDGRLVYPGYYGGGVRFLPLFGTVWGLLVGVLFFPVFLWRSWGRGPGGWGGELPRPPPRPAAPRPPES